MEISTLDISEGILEKIYLVCRILRRFKISTPLFVKKLY